MPENKVFRKEVERSQTSKSRRTNQQNMQDQKKEPEWQDKREEKGKMVVTSAKTSYKDDW